MNSLRINGGKTLNGEVTISGAKNSAVALICASILSDDVVKLTSVPDIADVHVLIETLEYLGCVVEYNNEELTVDPRNLKNIPIPEELSSQMRASYYFMGAYIGKFNEVVFGMPGGCNLGDRPIDFHLFGFSRLNCDVDNRGGCYHIKADKLEGNKIFLDFASVGATMNIMLAAVRANGMTIIENAAEEPEIVDLANFLNSMGAKVRGAGTGVIRIEGVSELTGTTYQVLPDRLQAGTYIVIGALCSDKLVVKNIIPLHLDALLSKLEYSGVKFEVNGDEIVVYGKGNYESFDIRTQPYPGFATDLQQPLTTFLTQCTGMGTIVETIYTERFRHVDHLNNMGANISRGVDSCTVMGPTKLTGNKVAATDLRAAAALTIAGLIAEGETVVTNIEHLIRGYDKIIEKLEAIGADIEII